MKFSFAPLAATIMLLASTAKCMIPLTVKVPAGQTQCFYGTVNNLESKIGFSFAVQSGGSFDIDVYVRDPDGQMVYSDHKQAQGENAFPARKRGEYEFCFSNDMSTYTDKVVLFELSIDSDIRASLPEIAGQEGTESLEKAVASIESRATELLRSLRYYRTRNNRNESTVKSTESRIFWFSFFEVVLMIGMGVLQVAVVQLFFSGSRKHLV